MFCIFNALYRKSCSMFSWKEKRAKLWAAEWRSFGSYHEFKSSWFYLTHLGSSVENRIKDDWRHRKSNWSNSHYSAFDDETPVVAPQASINVTLSGCHLSRSETVKGSKPSFLTNLIWLLERWAVWPFSSNTYFE